MEKIRITVPPTGIITKYVTPHFVIKAVLGRFIDDKGSDYISSNIGLVAMADLIGIEDNPTIKKIKAVETKLNTIQRAKDYMSALGIGLNQEGRTLGVMFNSILAEYVPHQLDAEQIKIFKGLIKPDVVTSFFNTLATTLLIVDDQTTITGADVLYTAFAVSPTPDTNWAATAIQLASVGKLTTIRLATLVGKLRMEHANPFEFGHDLMEVIQTSKIGTTTTTSLS